MQSTDSRNSSLEIDLAIPAAPVILLNYTVSGYKRWRLRGAFVSFSDPAAAAAKTISLRIQTPIAVPEIMYEIAPPAFPLIPNHRITYGLGLDTAQTTAGAGAFNFAKTPLPDITFHRDLNIVLELRDAEAGSTITRACLYLDIITP